MPFQSGFVSIIGKPNAGKSTLLNALLGEKISIVTSKIQTTRHRIKGILSTPNYQLVFSDTPGIIEAKYELHKSMMEKVKESLEDADVLLILIDASQKDHGTEELALYVGEVHLPQIIALNKADLTTAEQLEAVKSACSIQFRDAEIIAISALKSEHLDELLAAILKKIPEQEPFYPGEEITDISERFIISELIREKIFELFQKEIPYSSQVLIQDWKEIKEMLHIRAEIIVERESQKGIILGKGGEAIKKLGILSRKDIEAFLQRKIFLGLTVKVNANWRNDPSKLKYYGYGGRG